MRYIPVFPKPPKPNKFTESDFDAQSKWIKEHVIYWIVLKKQLKQT